MSKDIKIIAKDLADNIEETDEWLRRLDDRIDEWAERVAKLEQNEIAAIMVRVKALEQYAAPLARDADLTHRYRLGLETGIAKGRKEAAAEILAEYRGLGPCMAFEHLMKRLASDE